MVKTRGCSFLFFATTIYEGTQPWFKLGPKRHGHESMAQDRKGRFHEFLAQTAHVLLKPVGKLAANGVPRFLAKLVGAGLF